MTTFADCSYCGGQIEERKIDYDYRRRGKLLVITNVPAGVCQQCGETYFKPDVLKRMDESFHDIFDRDKTPDQVLQVPSVSL